MPEFVKKMRIVWILALLGCVFWLFWMKIVPDGKISYYSDFSFYNNFISSLAPADRLFGSNKIVGDPAYFSLFVPRRFEKARLTVEFKNESGRPLIEAGVLADKRVWRYDLKPLQNKILDNLCQSWDCLSENGLILFQRNKQYSAIDDFLKQPPPLERIAVYNYDLKQDFILPDYQPSQDTKTMCRPLEGAYQFYTYIKQEDLSFDFIFRDLNKNSDPDPVDIFVYYKDQEIYSESLDDDDGRFSGEDKKFSLRLSQLPEGVYKIGVRANSDIITRSITAKQGKMVFENKVSLASAPELSCGRNIFSGSRRLQFTTSLADRLGQVSVNSISGDDFSETVDILETYKQYETKQVLPPLFEIVMPSDGIVVSGDGLFSFSAEEYFDPRLKKAGEGFSPDEMKIDFVIARYVFPDKKGEWLTAFADFDLTNVYKENGRHSFLISIPGLRTEDGRGQGVEIKGLRVDLEGVNLWSKIKKIISGK